MLKTKPERFVRHPASLPHGGKRGLPQRPTHTGLPDVRNGRRPKLLRLAAKFGPIKQNAK